MRCIQEENLFAEDGSVHSYCMDTGGMVGASEGKETRFIYVEHLRWGDVHGRPIAEDELTRRGVKL